MSSTDTLKYHVFSYFWEKGYFLTAGGKFGGDFLVYPGMSSFNIISCDIICRYYVIILHDA